MFFRKSSTDTLKSEEMLSAIGASQAIISFRPDGTILTANSNFLTLLGYRLDEVENQHHGMFLDQQEQDSAAYTNFWASLRSGQSITAEFRRKTKSGSFVWIQGCYSPVKRDGQVIGVVKVASDITSRKLASVDALGQLSAIDKAQATIEFDLMGNILAANKGFCTAMGYAEDEIVGRHHSIFVDPAYADSPAYAAFWLGLATGQYQSAQYLRMGKGGREVWIQASYNPILDADGKPYKVVKYATDITQTKAAVSVLGAALELLAQGDLSCNVDTIFPDELDVIRQAFNKSVGRFAEIVKELRETSGQLRSATSEILAGANDLSERTTRQAAAIEQTSAAVEQISQTVASNSKRTDAARSTTLAIADGATVAGKVMSQADEAMQNIATQAAKISNVIGLIDDIAFQTNLLALNASVEAARAGDAGKGFAVVAVEVRRLAQSAASASKDVKQLIDHSNDAVANGTRLVTTAADSLAAVVSKVGESKTLMEEIAIAGQEQANAVAEVSIAVREMDEMTQHNAALVEEINAAIEQTESQAAHVDKLIEVFTLRQSEPRGGVTTIPRSKDAAPKPRLAPKPAAMKPSYGVHGNAAVSADWNEF